MSTLREKLEALTSETCNGVGEYLDCEQHSAKAQAMARALLHALDFAPPYVGEQLSQALDKADEIR